MADVPLPNIARDMKHQKTPLTKPVILQETHTRTNQIATRAELRAQFGVEPDQEDEFFQNLIPVDGGDWRYEVDGIWRLWVKNPELTWDFTSANPSV